MSPYTYTQGTLAHCGNGTVIVPDQIADHQYERDGTTFPARRLTPHPGAPKTVRVRLRGDLYGLHTSGTGDLRVTCV